MEFQHLITKLTGPESYLLGLSDLLVCNAGHAPFLYSVSAKDGGVLAMNISNGLQVFDQAAFPSRTVALDAPRQLAETVVNGSTALISYGQYGTTLDVFPLDGAGFIRQPYTLNWQDTGLAAMAATAAEVLNIAGRSYFTLASRQEKGLTVWEADAQNRLRPIEQGNTADLLPANDILAMAQTVLGGQQHLLVLSSRGDGLLNYVMDPNGQLILMSRVDARDGLAIGTGNALEVVTVAGQSYALVGAAGSSSLAVVALRAGGAMVVTDHVMDDRNTRFAGLTELTTLTQNGQVYIAVAGSDDGVTLMTLLPNGRLVHLGTLIDDTTTALTNVSGLTLSGENGRIDLLASGYTPDAAQGSGISYLYSLMGQTGVTISAGAGGAALTGGEGRDQLIGGAGNDRISGGAGADILVDGAGVDTLTGGSGADLFIFLPDGQADIITDFERGIDRLDLSALGRIYSMDAIRFVENSKGATIYYGDEQIILQTSDGMALHKWDLQDKSILDLSHLNIFLIPPPDIRLLGTTGADYIDGRDEADLMIGFSGADTLLGGAGDDSLLGGEEYSSFDQATAQVYRLYRATLDRAADPNGLLAWADHLVGGTRSLTQVTAGFVGSIEFQTTYANLDSNGFTTLLYANVLDRTPNTAELNAWANLLNAGTRTREQVVMGFSESAEFKQKTEAETLMHSHEGLKMDIMDDVFRLFQAVLDRAPDQVGFHGWANRLVEGKSFSSVITGFVNSAEFQATYGHTDNRAFVSLLYANVLERLPDATGLNTWVNGLASGRHSRESVVQGFVQSPEFIASTAPHLKSWVIAQGYDDVLEGGTGANLLFGGLWADTFEFKSGTESINHVIGLEPWDRLSFQGFGYDEAKDVLAHLSQNGDTTMFKDQGVTIFFDHSSQAEISATTFLF